MNDIICALPTRLVAIFKDYLYYDDPTEYLRRWYTLRESVWRMPKIWEFLKSKDSEVRRNEQCIVSPHILGEEIQRILHKNRKKKSKAWADRVTEIEKRKNKNNGGEAIILPKSKIAVRGLERELEKMRH